MLCSVHSDRMVSPADGCSLDLMLSLYFSYGGKCPRQIYTMLSTARFGSLIVDD